MFDQVNLDSHKGEIPMTLRNLLTVGSIVSLVFGLGFLFAAEQLTSFYNVKLAAGGVFVAQLYGAALIAFGVLNWLGRDVTDAKGRQALVLANLVGEGLGFVISLLAQLAGAGGVNSLGWSTVAIFFLIALGFAYFQFVKKSA
jgi:hypothetical protein